MVKPGLGVQGCGFKHQAQVATATKAQEVFVAYRFPLYGDLNSVRCKETQFMMQGSGLVILYLEAQGT